MFIFKKEFREEVLQGRSIKYLSNKILNITPVYLSNILNGKIGCSKRLAIQILKCVTDNEDLENYFIIKEK